MIPVHNEAIHLIAYVTKFLECLSVKDGVRIILVENGSTDNTFGECHSLAEKFPENITVLRSATASYGAAIRRGIEESKAEIVSILEVDFLDEKFVASSRRAILEEDYDLTIGSKRHKESVDLRPWNRILITFFFNLFLKLFFGFKGTDTHGLKTFKGGVAQRLFSFCITSDESLQTEVVLVAEKLQLKKKELPVYIQELRAAPISVVKRGPKVIRILKDLRRSLRRDFSSFL